MTVLDHRRSAADELEGAPMPIPQQGLPTVPGTSAIPWWTGVPGLDPDCRYAEWVYAAECSAIACGIHVLGADAGRADWLKGQIRGPVTKWVRWLTEGGQAQAPKRTLVLRMLCERSTVIGPDHILTVAQSICAAGTLR